MPEQTIPKCFRCGSELIKIKDKNYWGCSKWLPPGLGKGCEGTIWFPNGTRKMGYPIKAFSYKVASKSNPGHYHIVIVYESGDIDCPCPAGEMGKFCRHKQEVIKQVGDLIKKIKEKWSLLIAK